MSPSKLTRLCWFPMVAVSVVGCLERSDKKKSLAGEGVASAALSSTDNVPPTGDTGNVEGTVYIEGDPAPTQPNLEGRIPSDCAEAFKMYQLLFREGAERRVADVFVGVTNYQGIAGARSGIVPVVARGCAWDRRTYGLTTEQHLLVKSADEHPYVPTLAGTKSKASLIAVPNGDPMPVFPKGPGMYVLVDEMRNFTQATILVVKFPTFDVTGLDGKFHIKGVPAGPASVSAFLPTVNLNTDAKINVTKGATTRVTLKLKFDAAAFMAAQAAAAAPNLAASAAPASAPAPSPTGVAGKH